MYPANDKFKARNMIMGPRYVCRFCQRAIKEIKLTADSPLPTSTSPYLTFRLLRISIREASTAVPRRTSAFRASKLQKPQPITRPTTKVVHPTYNSTDPSTLLRSVVEGQKSIATSTTVPDELDVLELLEKCRGLSEILVFGETDALEEDPEPDAENEGTSTSSLLDNLEEESRGTEQMEVQITNQLTQAFRQSASASLSRTVDLILTDHKIFITPEMLQVYVRVQALLGRPERMPEIFYLYANKPVPRLKTHPIEYINPDPRSVKNAIPTQLADAALECAIAKRNLPLALSIIDTTFRAPAFPRAKLLKKVGPPFAAIACLPVAAAAAGNFVADWQNTLDPSTALWMTVAGVGTYFGVTGTIGYVALTTSNDQMERVTWAPGLGLWKRWMREEERSAFDRIALAWGFKDRRRRGEETGEDWEALREFCGLRDMVLDKTNLMDDME